MLSPGPRTRLDSGSSHERVPLLQLSDGHIRNNYTLKVRNMESRPRRVAIAVDGLPKRLSWTEAGTASAPSSISKLPGAR